MNRCVLRGGSWFTILRALCSAYRNGHEQERRDGRIGFRLIQEDTEGSFWVLRGGTFASHPKRVRCACRGNSSPDLRGDHGGFRLVQEVTDE